MLESRDQRLPGLRRCLQFATSPGYEVDLPLEKKVKFPPSSNTKQANSPGMPGGGGCQGFDLIRALGLKLSTLLSLIF
jgi:hypothetical protein